jgi:4-hydroxy-4-methyl-2-oxoglutarate aldolase
MAANLIAKSADLDKIRALDTCTVANAIERLKVRLRNEGFISGAARCRFPNLAPMVGYAVTGRIRSSSPPMSGRCYYDRMDFWNYLTTIPSPRVLVLQDVDHAPGFGAFVGEIHATICQALQCIGYVSNGSVRDLPSVRALGFHLFSGSVAVSHAYAHLVDFGEPVEIGGLKISPGDLLQGDRHGVQIIPADYIAEIAEEAARLQCAERELIDFCRSSQFSLTGLSERLKEVAKDCL